MGLHPFSGTFLSGDDGLIWSGLMVSPFFVVPGVYWFLDSPRHDVLAMFCGWLAVPCLVRCLRGTRVPRGPVDSVGVPCTSVAAVFPFLGAL